MGQFRERMRGDLVIGRYSPRTQKIYPLYAGKFAEHFMRSPSDMGGDEVRLFLLHLIEKRHASRGTIRQVQ